MCGFVTCIGSDAPSDRVQVGALARNLAHRGPDGSGEAVCGASTLAHRRLAVVDPAHGHQPMCTTGGTDALVYNGEVYNQELLRERLTHEGAVFESASDTEVVFHGAKEWGISLLRMLDGMFSFVAVDGSRFLAARDPLGIKPLYAARRGGPEIWFASELKGLPDDCIDIEEVSPGWAVTECGPIRWYSPPWEQPGVLRPQPSRLRELVRRAVDKRLMSDVPVGAFLSGGLDSSIVTALMRTRLDDLSTFVVGMEGAPDLDAAREVAAHLGTRHYERLLTADEIVAAVPRVIEHLESFDVALVRSAVPCFFVSALASEHVKVVLTGEGADEIFGGYRHFATIRDPIAFHEECVRLLNGLHNMNLQRVDRMTMAHGIEGRVPFLDLDLVGWVMAIDPASKMWRRGVSEKQLLRWAFEGWLPPSVLFRRKAEFADGADVGAVLAAKAESLVSDADFQIARARWPDGSRTKEAVWYRRIFDELFPGEPWSKTVGQWPHTQEGVA